MCPTPSQRDNVVKCQVFSRPTINTSIAASFIDSSLVYWLNGRATLGRTTAAHVLALFGWIGFEPSAIVLALLARVGLSPSAIVLALLARVGLSPSAIVRSLLGGVGFLPTADVFPVVTSVAQAMCFVRQIAVALKTMY